MNGDVIVLAPVGGVVVDDDLSRFYLARRQVFLALGSTALIGTAGTMLLGSAAFFWNSRRPPSAIAPARQRPLVVWRALSQAVTRAIVRRPVAQAAFFFTLRVLFRSGPHRLTLAVGAAVAVSMTIAVVSGSGLERAASPTTTHLWLWALQPLVLITLAATLRHAMALPAELRANWIFHHCWAGQLHQCVAGAERAGFIAVMAPAVLILAPMHAYVMGPGAALFHGMNGMLLSALLLRLAGMDRTAPPFLSSYVRTGNVRSLGPIFVMVAVGISLMAATMERAAVGTAFGSVRHTLALLALVVAVHQIARRRLPAAPTLTTDAPEPSADPLRLSG